MFGIVPGEKSIKVSCGLVAVQKSSRILEHRFNRSECGFYKRVVIGGSRSSKQLRHLMGFKHSLDRFGFHLTAPIIDNLRALILGQIENVFGNQAAFKKSPGFLSRLMPVDPPVDGFAGILIEQQIKIKEEPLLTGRKITDIPAPSLVRTGQLFSNWWKGSAIVVPMFSTHGHQALGT